MLKNLLKKIPGVKRLPGDLSYEEAREVLERNDLAARNELAGREDARPEMLYHLGQVGPAQDHAVHLRPCQSSTLKLRARKLQFDQCAILRQADFLHFSQGIQRQLVVPGLYLLDERLFGLRQPVA